MRLLLSLSLAALTLAASPNEEFALQEQLDLKSGQAKELVAKINRDLAIRFSHAAAEDPAVHSQSPPAEDPATHSQSPPALHPKDRKSVV